MAINSIEPESLGKAAVMLKALAHPVRISIVSCLAQGGNKTVTRIHREVGIEQAAASHHLGILKDKGILGSRRKGKSTLYFLRNEKLSQLLECVGECCK